MVIIIYTLLLLGCSTVLSAVAFLVGRCGRRLPIDGMLPRVVHGVRFDSEPEEDFSRKVSEVHGHRWPHAS